MIGTGEQRPDLKALEWLCGQLDEITWPVKRLRRVYHGGLPLEPQIHHIDMHTPQLHCSTLPRGAELVICGPEE